MLQHASCFSGCRQSDVFFFATLRPPKRCFSRQFPDTAASRFFSAMTPLFARRCRQPRYFSPLPPFSPRQMLIVFAGYAVVAVSPKARFPGASL